MRFVLIAATVLECVCVAGCAVWPTPICGLADCSRTASSDGSRCSPHGRPQSLSSQTVKTPTAPAARWQAPKLKSAQQSMPPSVSHASSQTRSTTPAKPSDTTETRQSLFAAFQVSVLAPNKPTTSNTTTTTTAAAWLPVTPSESARGTLSLDQAIDRALQNNPDLLGQRAVEPVQHAAYHVAATYPYNPQLSISVAPHTREADGTKAKTDQSYALMETFELAHQRRHRKDAAAASLNQTRWSLQRQAILVTATTEQLFFEALYRREVRGLSQALASLNRQMLETIEHRFTAGQASQADVVLARLELESSRQAADLAEIDYQTALAALRQYLNIPASDLVEPVGDLLSWQWLPVRSSAPEGRPERRDSVSDNLHRLGSGPQEDVRASESSIRLCSEPVTMPLAPPAEEPETLTRDVVDQATLAEWLDARPDLQAARAAVQAAQAQMDLARAGRVPNLQIGPAYQRDEAATEFWGLQAQISLPLVNTGKPLVQQRRAELSQRQIELEQLTAKTQREIETAVQRYARARRMVQKSHPVVRQPVPEVLQPFQDQFEAGQMDLLHVLSARRSVIQTRRAYLDLIGEVAQAAAGVTAATGLPARSLLLSGEQENARDE